MNVRKPIDYSALYAALDALMAVALPQMELYCKIGKLVSARPEKGAAVAAAEYLHSTYPGVPGFSPRNLRRMRDFYRTYEDAPEVQAEAMTIGWTQNTVILEAELTVQEKSWYIRAVRRFGWSKLELMEQIASAAHRKLDLDEASEVCYTEENSVREHRNNDEHPLYGEDRQHGLSPITAHAVGALNPWHTEFCAMGTPIPMGTIPAPSWANGTRKASDGRFSSNHRAGRFSTRDRMAGPFLKAAGKLGRSPKRSAVMSQTSPQSCWEPTICSRALAFPPQSALSGWNSS